MNINNGRATIVINKELVTISFYDADAKCEIIKATMTAIQFCLALGNLYRVKCKNVEIFETMSKFGKKQAHITWSTIILNKEHNIAFSETFFYPKTKEIIREIIKKKCPKRWIPDIYLESKNSIAAFISKNGDKGIYVTTTIRQWVDIDPLKGKK